MKFKTSPSAGMCRCCKRLINLPPLAYVMLTEIQLVSFWLHNEDIFSRSSLWNLPKTYLEKSNNQRFLHLQSMHELAPTPPEICTTRRLSASHTICAMKAESLCINTPSTPLVMDQISQSAWLHSSRVKRSERMQRRCKSYRGWQLWAVVRYATESNGGGWGGGGVGTEAVRRSGWSWKSCKESRTGLEMLIRTVEQNPLEPAQEFNQI